MRTSLSRASQLSHLIYPTCPLQIEVARNYGLNEWHEDLKRFCRRAGADNKPCVLLFSDTQVGMALTCYLTQRHDVWILICRQLERC